jgi:hypothetical protein
MNRADVEAARAEAVRFIERCDALVKSEVDVWDHKSRQYVKRKWVGSHQAPSKEAAAAKRSSLDLTRSLAHMRRRS